MLKKIIYPLGFSVVLLTGCTPGQIISSAGAIGTAVRGLSVSNEELIAYSKLSAQSLDANAPIAADDNPYAIRLEKLTKNLKDYNGLKLNFKVYLVKDVNAFAMPDGTVRVFSGLMDMMDDDELLAVIGHEIGHVSEKHRLKQYRKAYLLHATKQGVQAIGGIAGTIASAAGPIGESFFNAQFSQADELNADEYGIKFLKQLGRDPYAAFRAQEKITKLGKGGGGMFSSHPSSKKRIENARRVADKLMKEKA